MALTSREWLGKLLLIAGPRSLLYSLLLSQALRKVQCLRRWF
jgi:hypothetical protein